MKKGTVLLLGRPNVGKSTFVNNVVGQKVAITSPKPQTTRFPIQGLYEDERGTIIFTDTPGIFEGVNDPMVKKINEQTVQAIHDHVDIAIYMIDPTRKRDFEEANVLGIVRKLECPVILVFNTKEKEKPYFMPQYAFLKDEFSDVFTISALKQQHVKPLLDRIFELLPEQEPNQTPIDVVHPVLNIDSKTFIAELIREKVFLMMGEEIPYSTTAIVDAIEERKDKTLYIKARILTTNERHKGMLIGKAGRKIKEIGSYARKEIALATNKKVFLDLKVEQDPHWQATLYS
ncbi:GTPase Era [Candidatus Woesebacteria bacterium]|nr:GTPase Era [Candidatus Woesebacteria bacterium]